MKYVVRKINDNKYALEEIIHEDDEGRYYTETLAYNKSQEYLVELAEVLNGNHRPHILYA